MAEGDFDFDQWAEKAELTRKTYLWVSVNMRFDRAYRQLQAQHGFRCGSDSPHLDALHLRARQPGQQFPANSHVTQPPKDRQQQPGNEMMVF